MYGPFEVLTTGKNGRYCTIRLPDFWKIHPTFNIALLERNKGTDPKKQVIEIEADDAGWKMEWIMASRPSDDDVKKHVDLLKWEGYSQYENTWEMYENTSENSMYVLKEYYGKNLKIERDGRYGKRKK